MSIKLSSLNTMPDTERRMLLEQFNDTKTTYPLEATLVSLFEEQAESCSARIALRYEHTEMTYATLNSKANRLAIFLRQQGVKPNQVVGILFSRSPGMVISILAVLKAGGAYMPIDPEYPKERIQYMLEDSKAQFCITEDQELLPEDVSIKAIVPDLLDDDQIEGVYATNLKQVNQPSDLAYIIYTSGSTGKPKGVMIEHSNVVRLLFNDRNLFDFTKEDVWTLFHSFCFDFSVWEMYGALLYGARLIIVPLNVTREPAQFLSLLQKEQVTILNQTPTAFYRIAKLEVESDLHTSLAVRKVIFGGEALQPIQLLEWKKKYPQTQLINMYGITETTVHVTYKEMEWDDIQAKISNIGKPIPTLQIYILDEQRELVPIGVEGEIYVGGAGLARGYLNREELTAERFVPHPFAASQRLYRTGDLARWQMNGELEYLGRIDHQVKIRGFRIELGEIESRLLEIDGVQQAVVTVREADTGESVLCAYYVSDRLQQSKDLRTRLSQHLPRYMLPAHYIQMKTLPMTLSNKVDTRALPAPSNSVTPTDVTDLVMPSHELEWQMLNIWQEMLDNRNMGVECDYFELGGDSIRVIELISRMNRELGLHIQISDMYDYPTIRNLVRHRSTHLEPDNVRNEIEMELLQMRTEWLANPALRALLPSDVEDVYPMSDIQQGMVFHYMKNEGLGVYHDQFIYQIHGHRIQVLNLQTVMNELISRHPILRTGFNISDFPVPVQYSCERIDFEIQEVVLEHRDTESIEQEIRNYMELDRKRPFDIEHAPLWRLVIFNSTEESYVGWIFHHAILDGWSVAVFMSELLNLYGALKGGEVSA
ncbi:amino acid adenylation domain-containing protein [Paenibacillus sp. RRE4]|uniref:non-ribosomal peptide synthetase n=1 Tax=Paenibacillus sp. RRE4 TaxID=2962587 RepID=UPI00288168B4|nr:amino acid adenylation domain-containing protein [Paenibacillus sp. RRE4]MDT0123713.1 amino acid adenylation domain-containing protein [Paenibacillus sp. RRE4]